MSAFIIRKKDLKRLGKELVKELYEFFNDDYIYNSFPEMREEREKFLNNLTKSYSNQTYYTKIQKEISWLKKREPADENKFSKELEEVKKKILNGTLPLDVIFSAVNDLNFGDGNNELEEDLYAKADAFINIFKVYDYQYSFLED